MKQDNSPMDMLHAWQRYRDLTDIEMCKALDCSRNTWRRYLKCESDITHEMLIRAVNILRIPHDDAVRILTTGIRSTK